jgi:hypothetical protein
MLTLSAQVEALVGRLRLAEHLSSSELRALISSKLEQTNTTSVRPLPLLPPPQHTTLCARFGLPFKELCSVSVLNTYHPFFHRCHRIIQRRKITILWKFPAPPAAAACQRRVESASAAADVGSMLLLNRLLLSAMIVVVRKSGGLG